MTTYPTQPTGDNSIDLTNIFASNATNKIIMSTEEILEGYNNDGEAVTPLTSTPDGNKFNYFWYQVHNTLAWVVNYTKALFDNKLEKSGDTMSGALAMGSNKITGLSAGTTDLDAVNKLQLDTAVSGAMWLSEVKYLSYPNIPTLPSGMEVVNADGRALSKTTYSTLYALIGTTYGGTELGTTFNIPDLLGKSIMGWDSVGAVDSGRSFGSDQKRESSKFILKPDYVNRVSKSANTTYVATENGKLYWYFGNANATAMIRVDGIDHVIHYTTQGQNLGFFYDIKKGQTYMVYGPSGTFNVYWNPEILTSENSAFTQTNIALYPVIRIK